MNTRKLTMAILAIALGVITTKAQGAIGNIEVPDVDQARSGVIAERAIIADAITERTGDIEDLNVIGSDRSMITSAAIKVRSAIEISESIAPKAIGEIGQVIDSIFGDAIPAGVVIEVGNDRIV